MEYPHYFSPGAASGISLLFPGGRARSGCPRWRGIQDLYLEEIRVLQAGARPEYASME